MDVVTGVMQLQATDTEDAGAWDSLSLRAPEGANPAGTSILDFQTSGPSAVLCYRNPRELTHQGPIISHPGFGSVLRW